MGSSVRSWKLVSWGYAVSITINKLCPQHELNMCCLLVFMFTWAQHVLFTGVYVYVSSTCAVYWCLCLRELNMCCLLVFMFTWAQRAQRKREATSLWPLTSNAAASSVVHGYLYGCLFTLLHFRFDGNWSKRLQKFQVGARELQRLGWA